VPPVCHQCGRYLRPIAATAESAAPLGAPRELCSLLALLGGGRWQTGAMTMTETMIQKNALEQVRVAVSDYRGGRYVDARIWTQTGDGQDWVPTKKGVTLKPELAREVAEAMIRVAEEIEGGEDG